MATTADIPNILRNAGLSVAVEDTWDLTPLGAFPIDNPKVMWHHDASPVGPSAGALGWITSSYRAGNPSAQLWVDTDGVWHCVGKGKASHAGKTDGSATNADSVGVETDHTTGESWPDALLTSLRSGTAALLTAFGRTPAGGLFFHKTSAIPYGRKQDPDGLELGEERRVVGVLMSGPITAPTTPTAPPTTPPAPTVPQEDDMATNDEVLAEIRETNDLLRELLGVSKTELPNLRDVRTFTEGTRDAFTRLAAGRDVMKVRVLP